MSEVVGEHYGNRYHAHQRLGDEEAAADGPATPFCVRLTWAGAYSEIKLGGGKMIFSLSSPYSDPTQKTLAIFDLKWPSY